MSRQLKAWFAGAATAVVTAGLVTLPASSAEAHDGTPPAQCQGDKRAATKWAKACFEWNGDDQWLRDKRSNGRSVMAHIQTSYGKDRQMVNDHGAPLWHERKLNHYEGNCVRWKLYELTMDGEDIRRHGPWSHWRSTSTGNRCD